MLLKKILDQMGAIIASGQFTDSKVPFEQEREEVIGEITDPDLKALYTLVDRSKAEANEFRKKILRKTLSALGEAIEDNTRESVTRIISEAKVAEDEILRLDNEIAVTDAVLSFELMQAFPETARGGRVGHRAGWLLVKEKKEESHPLDDLLATLHSESPDCGRPDCPVHGDAARSRETTRQRHRSHTSRARETAGATSGS